MAAAGNPPGGGGATPAVMIGIEGQDWVATVLSQNHPSVAIREIQEKGSMHQVLCAPLLGLTDQLGISRAEAHKSVLHAAKGALLAKVEGLDKIRLERLLEASFAYLVMPELRDVPLAVMSKLDKVPPTFLKQLTADKQVFKDLPAKVQRQVWEFDKNLLQSDALPLVGQYNYEVATIMRALAMDEFLAPSMRADQAQDDGGGGPGGGSGAPGGITRKILRKGSKVLQALKEMVGTSHKIYNQILELCEVKFRDSPELYLGLRECSYVTLRGQLTMALHDDNNAVATRDRCHELVWTLDAGIQQGRLTAKHLAKLTKFFDTLRDAEEGSQRRAASASAALHGGRRKGRALDDEQESAGHAGGALAESNKVLGDAAMVLRDPSATHLLLATALRLVRDAAAESQLPRRSPDLEFVLSLLLLSMDAKHQMRDRKYHIPSDRDNLMGDLLPVLAGFMVDYKIHGSPPANQLMGELEPDLGLPAAVLERVTALLLRSELARKLTQLAVLERLLHQDALSAAKLLQLLATTTGQLLSKSDRMVPELAAFAATLALRLADMLKAGKLVPGCQVWRLAVDNILMRAVESHTQAHEEVLRLLLAAAPQLQPKDLGTYLRLSLENSRKSRKRSKKHQGGDPLADFPMSLLSDMGSDIGSDGWPGILQLKAKGTDGVKFVYARFRPKLSRADAPELYAYLEEEAAEAAAAAALPPPAALTEPSPG